MFTPNPNLLNQSVAGGLANGSRLADIFQQRQDRKKLSQLADLFGQGNYEAVGAGLVEMGQVGQSVNVANIPYRREQQALQRDFQNAQFKALQGHRQAQLANAIRPDLPDGHMWNDPNNPSAGVSPLPGYDPTLDDSPETWRAPQEEIDPQTGKPIIVQYSSRGARRVIEGAAPAGALVKQDIGNEVIYTNKYTGEVVKRVPKDNYTPEQEKQLGKSTAEAAVKAFEDIGKVETSIGNMDEAIAALDRGANAGLVYKRLPAISESSASLRNAMNRMGLDVIGSVTFGALSEGEMRLAMETAVPQNLGPEDLREWLTRKRDAQAKARQALFNAANYLSTPGNTLNGWLQQQNRQRGYSDPRPGDATANGNATANPTVQVVPEGQTQSGVKWRVE